MISPGHIIADAAQAGLTLWLDGDHIGFDGPMSDAMRVCISANRAAILAELSRRKSPPCPTDIAECAAALEIGNGLNSEAAEALALSEHGFDGWPAFAAAHRQAILADLAAHGSLRGLAAQRLATETDRAVKSNWFGAALQHGWSIGELFGMADRADVEVDRQPAGLFVGLILSPHRPQNPPKLIEITRAGYSVQFRSGSVLVGHRFRPFDMSVAAPWWQHPAILAQRAGRAA